MSSGYASRSGSRAVRRSAEEVMENNDESEDKDDTKRKSRNASEKKRRDLFNSLINELAAMVNSPARKMDKSSVLKNTIGYLKSYNDRKERSKENELHIAYKPDFLTNEEYTHIVLEAVCGFYIVFSSSGKIIYVSESVATLLGHHPNSLLNKQVYDFVSEHDRERLYNMFLNPVTSVLYEHRQDNEISFLCYFKRQNNLSDEVLYELVRFTGYFRADMECLQVESSENRYGGYDSGEANDTRLLFVGTGRLVTPQIAREIVILDNGKNEFTSRYSLQWKYIFLDHRATPIIGYRPFEILGTSGYDYYHMDDLDNLLSCHLHLMLKGEGTSCYYRFLTKGQEYIWLQSRFFITYHQWTSKPQFVVCSHKVISHANVLKFLQKEQQSTQNTESQYSKHALQRQSSPWPSRSPGSKSSHSEVNVKLFPSQKAESDTSMSVDSVPSRNPTHTSTQNVKSRCVTTPTGPPRKVAVMSEFVEPPVTYPVAIPLQPLAFAASSSIVTTVAPEVAVRQPVVMSSSQTQIQDELQKKHQQLQQMIVQQQEELRKVSEQLIMARFGLLSPILNVNVPVSYTMPVAAPHLSVPAPHLSVPASHLSVPTSHLPVTASHLPVTASHLPVTASHLPVSAPSAAELFVPAHTTQRSHITLDPHQVNYHQQSQTTGESLPFQFSQQQAQQYLFSQSMDSPNSTRHSQ
ncbi:circadian locomoter output cycles protein kaput isoform X1 [Homalodisca vitripennis]|uniref:circadian locomoter output cycles protein kaput isoform X1 n=2 Tax=Homalodisca vitripennis TaxID=197043 RepID=UPI001EE9F0BA|nr:circadian locomoter output cycles protein kaput isoform X1 [Homalodisca vitripennis]